jgi:hypothetical protein
MAGNTVWAGLNLLDRQMLRRPRGQNGKDRMAGCVDDLELTPSDDDPQRLYVTAIVSGPGALLYRLNRRRLGRWMQNAYRRAVENGADRVLLPFGRVIEITSHVVIDVDEDLLATAGAEHWVRDHVISHIPGSTHAAQ